MTLQELLADIHALEEDLLAFERKYGVRSESTFRQTCGRHATLAEAQAGSGTPLLQGPAELARYGRRKTPLPVVWVSNSL